MNGARCILCESKGVLMANLRDPGNDSMPGPFVFRCSCSAGRLVQAMYPMWNSMREKQFEISGSIGHTPEKMQPVPVPAKEEAKPLPANDFFDGIDD